MFVDTSAIYAALDADDRHHPEAVLGWEHLLDELTGGRVDAVTHGSVLVEATALVQHRLGMRAVRALHDDLLPVVRVQWVDGSLHARALSALLAAGWREVSYADWTSFELMRTLSLELAFTFDDHFAEQGFALWR